MAAPSARVFAIPPPGAGASLFTSWAPHFLPDVELCPLRFPGRESRIDEPPCRDMDTLTRAIVAAIAPLTDTPYAVFGQCAGGAIAVEVAKSLARSTTRQPECVVLSSTSRPDAFRAEPPLHLLPTPELFAGVSKWGGIDDDVLESTELMELFEPALRADYELIETWSQVAEPVGVPLVALRGSEDPFVSEADVDAWRSMTTAGLTGCVLDGGHLALDAVRDALIDLVSSWRG